MPDTPWLSIKIHSADYTNVFIRKQYIQNSMHFKKLAKWSDDPVMVFKKTNFKHFLILSASALRVSLPPLHMAFTWGSIVYEAPSKKRARCSRFHGNMNLWRAVILAKKEGADPASVFGKKNNSCPYFQSRFKRCPQMLHAAPLYLQLKQQHSSFILQNVTYRDLR